jgi:hypothetical protein
MIIIQLKSSHDQKALSNICEIISSVKDVYDYRIRGHEIHQDSADIQVSILRQRANIISSFCSKKDIEYITYHAPIPRNEGLHLKDERFYEKATNSLLSTLREAELVYDECGFKDKVVIVYHLPSEISLEEIPYLNEKMKFKILENAELYLRNFYEKNRSYFESFAALTVENAYPRCFTNGLNFSTINMFHPLEMIRLVKLGVKITFDLSHYSIYSSYLSYGRGNAVADLDRQVYGQTAPSWSQCIDIYGDSLRQLHINDGKGAYASGEGFMLGEGEIPIVSILQYLHDGISGNKERIVQGTIELVEGHLYNCKLQKRAVEWLLANTRGIFQ